MNLPLPKTRGQWAAVIAAVAASLAFLYFFTPVFHGKAVEVTVVNGRPEPVFVYIDSTGRHGASTSTVNMKTISGGQTPPGLVVSAGVARSFGVAVGFGDQPTAHVMPVESDGATVDTARLSDCSFDTVSFTDFKFPPWHVKVKITPTGCTSER